MDEERRHSNDLLLGELKGAVISVKDELTNNVNPKLDGIQEYNTLQNGRIAAVIEKCGDVSEKVAHNTTWIKALKWIIIVAAPSLGAALIYLLTKVF